MPAAHRKVSAVCGRQPIPGSLSTLALQARDRRVVCPPVNLVQRGDDTGNRIDHKTEWATPVRSSGRLELAFSQLLQALAYARTRPIRHIFHVANNALQPLAILAPSAQLAYRAPDLSQARVLDQDRL
jgi:hypothetical protein